MGRLKDIGANPLPIISNVRELLEKTNSNAEIIVGSIRHARDISNAQQAGAHIITASMKFFEALSSPLKQRNL